MRFTWNAEKNRTNARDHSGITFEVAQQVFSDPRHVVLNNYFFESEGEQRYQVIGMAENLCCSWLYTSSAPKTMKK